MICLLEPGAVSMGMGNPGVNACVGLNVGVVGFLCGVKMIFFSGSFQGVKSK